MKKRHLMPFLYYSSPFRSSSAVTEKTSHNFRSAVCRLQEQSSCTLNNTSPLPFGLSPIAQTCVISLSNFTSFARGEVGTHIDRDISLIMPLRFVRQAVANGRRSRLYCASSSALIGSPPCGSCSVCERVKWLYKNALNEWTLRSPLCKFADGGFHLVYEYKHIPLISTLRMSVR